MRKEGVAGRAVIAGSALATLLLSGCGPVAPLELSVQEYPTAVQYGQQPSTASAAPVLVPAPAPPPVLAAPPAFYPQPSAVELVTPVPTAAPACPSAGPLAPAAEPTTATPASPPAGATYAWRATGTYSNGSSTVQFPATDQETVSNVTNPDSQGVFSYDVTNAAGGLDGREPVTTTYEVVPAPGGGTVGGNNTNQASAIYITKVVTNEPTTGLSLTFTPSPPIEYLAVPASDSLTWSINSIDTSTTGGPTVESGSATITGHGRVDACGTVLDAWEVKLDVMITSPTQSLHLVEFYDVGNEYGGIPLEVHDATVTGSDGSTSVTSTSTETINVQPQAPS